MAATRVLDRPGAGAHLQRRGGEEAAAGEDAAFHIAEVGLAHRRQLGQAGAGRERGLDDFRLQDPLRLVHGGQLEFLLGAEVRVQAALADAGRGGQVPDRQALQPVDGGQRRGRAQDRAAGAFPVGPWLPRRAAALTRCAGCHVDKIARSVVLSKLARTIVLTTRLSSQAAGQRTRYDRKELTMNVTTIVNGVDLDRLSGTINAVTADPALARFQFRARNHWIDGGHSRTTIKGFYGAGQEDATRTQPFTVDADEPPVLLGENRAPNAGEFVLHALAACLSGTIVYHAAARGIALDGLETTIQGDLDLRGFLGLDSSVRPGYEQIQVTITAAGDFDDNQLAELASLIRYSPVRDIVSNPVPVAIDVTRG